jgi:PAS domain S-box-containing protein
MPAAAWPLAAAAEQRSEILVAGQALPGGAPIVAGPWPEPVRTVAILPIVGAGQSPHGLLVAGISARRPYDEGYRDFLRLVAANAAAAVGTARTLAEERARARALAELDRAKTLFFSNISHEFRTPLTLMLGPLEEVLEGGDPPARDKLDLAHRNGLRLLKLVNSLLDFSRIEAGRMEAAYAPVDLSRLTAELASVFRSAVEKAGLQLVVECPPLPAPIHVDREMWEKIVLNLISNALKFTFAGAICVRLRWTGDGAELAVSDTGTGIAAEHLPHLFERFYRVPNARSRTHEGSGIGLALVHELVKLHGGDIAVESAPDVGTTFRVRLRAGTAHLPKERIGDQKTLTGTSVRPDAFVEEALRWLPSEPDGAAKPDEASAGHEPRARILWADDNADMREYVRRLLSAHWQVEAVADGRAALELARRAPPDLVLADVMMPELDGFALLEALRNNARTRTVPVILLSARAGEEAKIEGFAAGADDYLVKPFSARELVARVRTHIEMKREREELAAKRHESDARFRMAVAAARLGVWDADAATLDGEGDDNLLRILGLPTGQNRLRAEQWKRLVHPEDRARVIEALSVAINRSEPFDIEFRVVRPDGEIRWLAGHGDRLPPRGSSGARIIGIAQDVTAHKKLIEAQQLLLAELNHRVRNTLSTVLSLSRQTAAHAGSLEDFVAAFEARIIALSAAHGLLTRRNWEAVSLRDLAVETLAPYLANGALEIAGPDCDVGPKHALALSLGLHELATNALKYGALSRPSGTIELAWEIAGAGPERAVRLRWSESGGPPVRAPTRRGFGTVLIERALASDLDGEVRLVFDPAGVRCEIVFTLEQVSGGRRAVPRDDRPGWLIVEDESLIAMLIEEALAELGIGCMGKAHRAADALALLGQRRPDAAILDVNLAGDDIYPVAEALKALNVPFAFVTGYGETGVPPALTGVPVLQKPFSTQRLQALVREMQGRGIEEGVATVVS